MANGNTIEIVETEKCRCRILTFLFRMVSWRYFVRLPNYPVFSAMPVTRASRLLCHIIDLFGKERCQGFGADGTPLADVDDDICEYLRGW